LALVLGAPAAAASSTDQRVRTIATIPMQVSSFAHSDRYVAWIAVPKTSECDVLFMQDVRTAKRTAIRQRCEGREGVSGRALVLAGDRAFWVYEGGSNLTEYTNLVSASLRKRRVTSVAYQSIYNRGFDYLVPPASDGRGVYFRSSPADATPGPIVRFGPRGGQRMTRTISNLYALGAGEGRWAFAQAKRTYDCAQEPAWSPAGRIAFASGGMRNCRGGIWVMNADGRDERRLTPSGRNPDWSPAGELVYDDGGTVKLLSDTGQPRALIARGTNPSWSPDGTIAFERDNAIVVADRDGGGERVLVAGAADPDWSPDGTQIVFARTHKGNPGLGIVGADGSGARSLTRGDDHQPTWSPDGQRIAYAHSFGGHADCPWDQAEIHEVAPDGGGRRTRTEHDDDTCDSAPSWAADSRRLVFVRSKDDGDTHISMGDRALTGAPPPVTSIVVRSSTGRTIDRLTPSGVADELAVTRRLTAALVCCDPWRLEILAPKRRMVTLRGASRVSGLSASGYRLVLRVGPRIVLYDIRTRRLQTVARLAHPPIGLSIVGRRIAWAENVGRRARVRAVVLPR
jgi:Tol biopolymer transport system component